MAAQTVVRTVGAVGSATRPQLTADRLFAQTNVRINSPQCVGATDRLETWFDAAPAPSGSPRDAAEPSRSGTAPQTAATPVPRSQVLPPLLPAPAMQTIGPAAAASAQRPAQQYSVNGQRIRMQLVVHGSTTDVEDVSIDGQARFVESRTAVPGEQPLVVAGDQIEVLRANQPDTDVTVRGKPAQVGARGLEMFGDVVRMNKQDNRMWIDGPGRMKLPNNAASDPLHATAEATARTGQEQRPPAQAAPAQDPMVVAWQGKMNFDGSVATFDRSVVGQSQTRNFQTEMLEVALRRRIDFSQPRMQDRAEVGRIVCHGQFKMESRGFDPKLGLTSIERMQAKDLMVDQVTGAILGQGPGWLTSVRKGSPDPTSPNADAPKNGLAARPVAAQTPRAGRKRPPATGVGGDEPLNYLNVQFQGALSGNLNQHELTFHKRIRTVYGPVLSWEDELNPDNVDELGPGGVVMTCDQMTVRQPDAPASNPANPTPRRPVELEALGNTLVEGESFTARAPSFDLCRGEGPARVGRGRPHRREAIPARSSRRAGLEGGRPANSLLAFAEPRSGQRRELFRPQSTPRSRSGGSERCEAEGRQAEKTEMIAALRSRLSRKRWTGFALIPGKCDPLARIGGAPANLSSIFRRHARNSLAGSPKRSTDRSLRMWYAHSAFGMSRPTAAWLSSVVTAICSLALIPAATAAEPAPTVKPAPLRFSDFLARRASATDADFQQQYARPDSLDGLPFKPSQCEDFSKVRRLMNDAQLKMFEKQGFVSVEQSSDSSFGGAYYRIYHDDLPVLVTSDSILHAMHFSFDNMLMEVEERAMKPAIERILTRSLTALAERRVAENDASINNYRDVDLYLTVALNLLAGNGSAVGTSSGWIASRMKQDGAVKEFLRRIAAGVPDSLPEEELTSLYGGRRAIDYSQFKPRGHYTKTSGLQNYFQAMMWLGRADCGWFPLPADPHLGIVIDNRRELHDSVLLVDLLSSAKQLPGLDAIDRMVSSLFGESDNLRPCQMRSMLEQAKVSGLADLDSAGETRLEQLLKAEPAGQQRIVSQMIYGAKLPGDEVPPPALFQMFGQRLGIDSFVLAQVTYDQLPGAMRQSTSLDAAQDWMRWRRSAIRKRLGC